MNFSLFQKPSRYIDNEFNVVKKETADVRVALSFPDTYEIGMSHLGLRILYEVINRLPFAAAERAFAPWTDLRDHMKKEGLPLCSLESKKSLVEFDVVGFSLQYELSYTTVLDMLDLAGIPLRASDRMQSRSALPLIVAGGPSAVNPAPMAAFIDAFLVGDGEEAVVELLKVVRQWKTEGGSREGLLSAISGIEGFYVPMVHGRSAVKRRYIGDLDSAPFPERPVVPFAPIVHDRISIEVARGCPMGCRFCQAGIIYRPLRERSPEKVMELAEKLLLNTGYDEVSFLSLSTGDYSCLLPLIKEFNRRFRSSRTAVSLPSLRVGSVSRDVLKEIRSVRKTGFTMAPEAATERLRSVINKDFTDADYERALESLFDEGWLTLKLYFMIGLPTERDEDIEAINEMAMRALRIAKRRTGKFVNINITVSPFIPKPHTPFQWHGQISLDEMKQKLGFLRRSINSKKFKYKGHNEEMSFLEAVFARGDEQLSGLIEEAWRSGCRLDGWSEFFDFGKWQQAMDRTGIDGAAYAGRHFEKDDPLPWDNIDVGVSRDFLYREYTKAAGEKMTADCRKACSACGLECKDTVAAPLAAPAQVSPKAEICPPNADSDDLSNIGKQDLRPKIRVRSEFTKTGLLRHLSHLELVTTIMRALRRAGIQHDFSKGFHPKPEISFGPPLRVGAAGLREYFDMVVFTPFDVQLNRELLNGTLPEGIRISAVQAVPAAWPSLTAFISRYEYIVGYPASPEGGKKKLPPSAVYAPGGIDRLTVMREGKEVDISPCIESVERLDPSDRSVTDAVGHAVDWAFRLVFRDSAEIMARPAEITGALLGIRMEDLAVVRTRMYGLENDRSNNYKEPL
ncbi:MAG TPA: TIGR03960 family B12-binding radical SAM protein [Dissulfurispiraceae bacterium]|nr:TIGR03960 family B12-binding radical SAM protein [Dissulfurispiraceae bacterium]